MMRGMLSAICFAVALAATPALAQDEGRGIGYVATGPIFDLPSGMSVERLEMYVSIRSVRLAYVFKSAKRQSVHFSFALPEMPVDAGPDIVGTEAGDEAAGFTADIEPVNYLSLSVQVNGRKLALGGHGRALYEGKDVTRRLLDAGVPLLYDPAGDAPWLKLPPEVQATLKADGLLSLDAANWTYQADFAWDQTFEPGETRVEVSYAPLADYWSDINLDDFPEIATDGSATQAYCIDDAVRRAFLSGEHYYELYTVTHLAAPAGGWRGPVGHYRLIVDKLHPADLVAFCPLAARKTSPTRFEWTATDYTPGDAVGMLLFWDLGAASSGEQE
ncbi:MAG: DUF4424 domain-containing protein [Hyphomicrobiales bacterium]|nr:DUF4424 domain-containing protein [Hyphomicrobiales bacterium]